MRKWLKELMDEFKADHFLVIKVALALVMALELVMFVVLVCIPATREETLKATSSMMRRAYF